MVTQAEISRWARSWLQGLGQRLFAMMAAWLLIGGALGYSISFRQQAESTLMFCNVLAGMIVCCVPGFLLGLVSGRAWHALFGAVGGMLVAATFGDLAGPAFSAQLAEICLIFGAIAGVTLVPYLLATAKVAELVTTLLINRASQLKSVSIKAARHL